MVCIHSELEKCNLILYLINFFNLNYILSLSLSQIIMPGIIVPVWSSHELHTTAHAHQLSSSTYPHTKYMHAHDNYTNKIIIKHITTYACMFHAHINTNINNTTIV